MFKKIGVYLGSAAALVAASVSSAYAANVDVTTLTGSIEDVNVVGAAVISVLVAVAAFKYVRRAF